MSGAVWEMAGVAVYVCASDGAKLDGEGAAADLVGEALGLGASVVVVPVERLGTEFLALRTRIAGEVIQKLVNYGIRLVVVGDISQALAASDALRDFVREANRGRHVWFVGDLAALEGKLASTP